MATPSGVSMRARSSKCMPSTLADVNLERFISSNEDGWDELEALVREAGTRPTSLSGEQLRRMGSLYRSAAADLAQARRGFPSDPVVRRLESVVAASRALVYTDRPKTVGFIDFYRWRYWELLVERPWLLGTAVVLFLGAGILGWVLAAVSPEQTASLVPEGFLWVTEPQPSGTDQGLSAEQLAGLSAFILANNLRATLLAFAGGILWGFGTFAVLVFNGIILGAIAGLAVAAGNSALLVEAVAAHGILELSCIVAGAVAGLRLASGLIAPGLRTRRVALVEEAGPAVLLALGSIPFLAIAALVEEFVSRTGTAAGPAVIIGLLLGGGYWALAARVARSEGGDRLGAEIGGDTRPAQRVV